MTHRVAKQYALSDDGSATSVFMQDERTTMSDDKAAGKVLLSGGFKNSTEEAPYPVSAALQLNGDLTDLDDDQLKRFADAELEKHHKISYRSYDVDADYRVCVIADDINRLDDFFDTYGGILEIEPLLIGPYHSDYATVQEIEIAAAAKGYTINYSVKSPINRSRCTYCGICGSICPEQCILENLYFDFSRCTYCNDCVKACPVEAIDLYSIERISLEIPALIVLGNPAYTEPDNTAFLYRESQLADFIATLYACRVDEIITCDHAICHFNGIAEAGCSACLSACKYGAVKTANKKIQINAFTCTECGSCAAICPTGALQNRKLTDQIFFEFFRTFEMAPDTRIIIGSDRNLHRFWWHNNQKQFERTLFLEVPNDNSVSLLNLLFLFSHGAAAILILTGDNSDPSLERTILEANLICRKTLGAERLISNVSDYKQVPENFPEADSVPLNKPYRDLSFVNRRRKLSSIVQYLTETSETPLKFDSGEVQNWGTIICDDARCTQCLACLNVCKIESLSADQENLSLCWNGGLCVGCSGCVATCPEQALTLKNSVECTTGFFATNEISRAEPMRCKGCGKVFGTKKSFDRVIAILTEKQGAPPEHLQYCEDCRILQIMESE